MFSRFSAMILVIAAGLLINQNLKAEAIDRIVSGADVPKDNILTVNNPTFNGAAIILLYSAEVEQIEKVNSMPDSGQKVMFQKTNWDLEDTRALAICKAMHYTKLHYRNSAPSYAPDTGLWTINPQSGEFQYVINGPTENGRPFTYINALVCSR